MDLHNSVTEVLLLLTYLCAGVVVGEEGEGERRGVEGGRRKWDRIEGNGRGKGWESEREDWEGRKSKGRGMELRKGDIFEGR